MSKTNNVLTETEIDTMLTERRASCAGHYPFLLCFERVFTSGTLEGIAHVDSLPFCAEGSAAEWVRKINAKNARGAMNYRVAAHVIRRLAA